MLRSRRRAVSREANRVSYQVKTNSTAEQHASISAVLYVAGVRTDGDFDGIKADDEEMSSRTSQKRLEITAVPGFPFSARTG